MGGRALRYCQQSLDFSILWKLLCNCQAKLISYIEVKVCSRGGRGFQAANIAAQVRAPSLGYTPNYREVGSSPFSVTLPKPQLQTTTSIQQDAPHNLIITSKPTNDDDKDPQP